ncbi:MAG: hypothetical protein ACFCGT_16260 [Sandaracinaceae bacterium]
MTPPPPAGRTAHPGAWAARVVAGLAIAFASGCTPGAAPARGDAPRPRRPEVGPSASAAPPSAPPAGDGPEAAAPAAGGATPAWAAGPDGSVPGVARLPEAFHRGVSVAHTYAQGGRHGYGTPRSRETLGELAALGVTWVSLTPFGYMRTLADREVHLVHDRPFAENDARLRREVEAAHRLGLRVLFKPHLWIGRGAWRGDLAPAGQGGWTEWFASYVRFIVHYAELAEELGVELLAIGTELPARGPEHEARWRAVIRAVRGAYTGPLTFAANWDRADGIAFWDAVDFIGVQFYPPLADGPGAPEGSMRARLAEQLDRIEARAAGTGRPALLTEVGYKSVIGTEVSPHLWPERHGNPEVSDAAQAIAYARLVRALEGRDRIRGLYVWKYFSDPGAREEGDDGFCPRGKAAEAVLRTAFGGRGCAPDDPGGPEGSGSGEGGA